jgi:hypothetical protein
VRIHVGPRNSFVASGARAIKAKFTAAFAVRYTDSQRLTGALAPFFSPRPESENDGIEFSSHTREKVLMPHRAPAVDAPLDQTCPPTPAPLCRPTSCSANSQADPQEVRRRNTSVLKIENDPKEYWNIASDNTWVGAAVAKAVGAPYFARLKGHPNIKPGAEGPRETEASPLEALPVDNHHD